MYLSVAIAGVTAGNSWAFAEQRLQIPPSRPKNNISPQKLPLSPPHCRYTGGQFQVAKDWHRKNHRYSCERSFALFAKDGWQKGRFVRKKENWPTFLSVAILERVLQFIPSLRRENTSSFSKWQWLSRCYKSYGSFLLKISSKSILSPNSGLKIAIKTHQILCNACVCSQGHPRDGHR